MGNAGEPGMKSKFDKGWVTRRLNDKIFGALLRGGEIVREDAQQSIVQGSISGAHHVPSLPGQPPNADTRQLDMSLAVIADRRSMEVEVRASAPYAAHLEYGTSWMAPRPYLRPAMQRNKRTINRLVTEAVKEK